MVLMKKVFELLRESGPAGQAKHRHAVNGLKVSLLTAIPGAIPIHTVQYVIIITP